MAKAGRKKATKANGRKVRKNSLESAREQYKGFHGRPSEDTVTVRTPIHYHLHLWGLGELVKLVIVSEDKRFRVTLRNFGGTLLASNEKRNQLFVEGGDQAVDLASFGLDETTAHENEVLGKCHRVYYYTTKDHLRPEDGGEAIYNHKFGGRRPRENPAKLRSIALTGRRRVKRNGVTRFVISKPPTVLYDTVNRLLSFSGGGYVIPDEGIDG